jgi:hypothetical protein
MSTNEQRQKLLDELQLLQQQYHALQRQQALMASYTPTHMLLQAEETQKQCRQLEAQLERLSMQQVASDPGMLIAHVAMSLGTPKFVTRAQLATTQFDAARINEFRVFFHNPPEKPVEVADKFNRLGEWMAVCQHAIFEIAYYYRETALPLLYKVAFGRYDWTQIRAIEVLCRLATEGVATEKIVEGVDRAIDHWRYEQTIGLILQQLAAFAALAPVLLPKLASLISEWQAHGDDTALEFVWHLAAVSPTTARNYETFLRQTMLSNQLDYVLTCIAAEEYQLDDNDELIFVDLDVRIKQAVESAIYPFVRESVIKAAFTLLYLYPGDQQALVALHFWSENHRDATIRQNIKLELERIATG